ncbi:MAG: hypothetical protein HW421_2335 [Ignavibacteria bacterium]|nr:hypothetical protein [Ignavibacteria bacterium]
MPFVDAKIGGITITDELRANLTTEITKSLQENVSLAFPTELGFTQGTSEWEIAHRIAHEIMPGWTWVTISEAQIAVRGKVMNDEAIIARFHIFVLANALYANYRQGITTSITNAAKKILGASGKPVILFVDVIEGEVDLTLPVDLFGDFLSGASEKLLTPGAVVEFIMARVIKELKSELTK